MSAGHLVFQAVWVLLMPSLLATEAGRPTIPPDGADIGIHTLQPMKLTSTRGQA